MHRIAMLPERNPNAYQTTKALQTFKNHIAELKFSDDVTRGTRATIHTGPAQNSFNPDLMPVHPTQTWPDMPDRRSIAWAAIVTVPRTVGNKETLTREKQSHRSTFCTRARTASS